MDQSDCASQEMIAAGDRIPLLVGEQMSPVEEQCLQETAPESARQRSTRKVRGRYAPVHGADGHFHWHRPMDSARIWVRESPIADLQNEFFRGARILIEKIVFPKSKEMMKAGQLPGPFDVASTGRSQYVELSGRRQGPFIIGVPITMPVQVLPK